MCEWIHRGHPASGDSDVLGRQLLLGLLILCHAMNCMRRCFEATITFHGYHSSRSSKEIDPFIMPRRTVNFLVCGFKGFQKVKAKWLSWLLIVQLSILARCDVDSVALSVCECQNLEVRVAFGDLL
jgi:hypothetical protein